MKNKLIYYFETLIPTMTCVLWIIGIDYSKLNSTISILCYCFLTGNLLILTFYRLYKFCRKMIEVKEND